MYTFTEIDESRTEVALVASPSSVEHDRTELPRSRLLWAVSAHAHPAARAATAEPGAQVAFILIIFKFPLFQRQRRHVAYQTSNHHRKRIQESEHRPENVQHGRLR